MCKGILLINLGTPAQCDAASVRSYLHVFLNDPRVVDLPVFLRWPFVNGIIIPLRYRRTLAAYRKIWLETGSPLLVYSQQIKEKLAARLGPDYQVELAMRYGEPSIASALSVFSQASITSLTILPLFPQYTSAATGSALEETLALLATQWNMPSLQVIHDFYAHPSFIQAYRAQIEKTLQDKKVDLLLFSYHGLPERHIAKSQCHALCDHLHACPAITEKNVYCYRAQCYATSQLIAQALGYSAHQYDVSFQSRLGRTPWIKPYTDKLLLKLIKKNIKHIAVVCPSFVVDCLETLEEVNIRLRKQWMSLGGREFTFIPCLNDSSLLIEALTTMASV